MLDSTVDLWATDEVHFQQHESRCRMWIPPEIKDPTLFHAPTRKSVGYFGAVRLRDGKFLFRRESGRFNAETFFQASGFFGSASRRQERTSPAAWDLRKYRSASAAFCSWRR
jgi:hypothetical protein